MQRRDLVSPSARGHAADIHSIAEVISSADRLGGYLRGQRGRREVEAGRLINDSEGRAQLQLRFLRVAENIVDKICGCGHVRLERGSKQSQSRVAHGSTIESGDKSDATTVSLLKLLQIVDRLLPLKASAGGCWQ